MRSLASRAVTCQALAAKAVGLPWAGQLMHQNLVVVMLTMRVSALDRVSAAWNGHKPRRMDGADGVGWSWHPSSAAILSMVMNCLLAVFRFWFWAVVIVELRFNAKCETGWRPLSTLSLKASCFLPFSRKGEKMVGAKVVANKLRMTGFDIVPPQDNGWSLTPTQNFMGGLRSDKDRLSLELVGWDGVVSYKIRTNNSGSVSGMLQSYFPQAVVSRKEYGGGTDGLDERDWMFIKEDEVGLVETLSLGRDGYLPLKIFDDSTIAQSMKDPLAGVIGLLGTSTRPGGESKGDRLGVRLVMRPAPGDWNTAWQDKMQKRRDGEDRQERSAGGQSGPGLGTLLGVGAIAAVGFANWWVWNNAESGYMVPLNVGLGGLGLVGYLGWNKLGGGKRRPYLDEELVEAKLKSLAYWGELQIVRVFHEDDDELEALGSVERLVECLRSFDDPAGNVWKASGVRRFRGGVCTVNGKHPFLGGNQILEWMYPYRAKKSALSAREVASLWHLPLGAEEMVSMERTAAGVLFPYLGGFERRGGGRWAAGRCGWAE